MVDVAKRLTHRIVAPALGGSNPLIHPIFFISLGGASPSGKARDFDSRIRRFKSCRPSHFFMPFSLWAMGASGGRGDEGLADVAELADASDLGSGTLQCAGSSPVIRTKKKMKRTKGFGPLVRFLY